MANKESPYVSPGQTFGRPSAYTDELADKICAVIERSPLSNDDLCRTIDFFPDTAAVLYEWANTQPYFSNLYMRAKKKQCAVRVEDLVRASDDESKDIVYDDKGKPYFNTVRVNRLRVKAGIVQWYSGCLDKKSFGKGDLEDKVDDVRRDLDEMKIKAAVEKKRDEL